MTLSTTRINQFGARLYKRMLDHSRLDPDLCSIACQEFVQRMRGFRVKHPGSTRVTAGFVRRCERWITANLLRDAKRIKLRAALDHELSKQELKAAHERTSAGNTVMYKKLAAFLSHWTRENHKAPLYARLFLLVHAWNMEPGRVRHFAPYVDGKKSEFVRQIKQVKSHLAERLAVSFQERAKAANFWYCKSLRADLEARVETGGRQAALKTRRAQYAERQRRSISRLGKIKTTPSVAALARIAGVSPKQVRYACELCRREMKRYFED